MDGDVSDSEKTSLINATQSKKQHPRYEVLMKYVRFVSAEIIVFSFVFVFYYYQNYTQQYLFQWFASEALNNATHSDSHGAAIVCYNQTLINKLSGSNSTINEVEGNAAHMNLMIMLATYIPSLIVNLVISPLSDKYGRKPAMILVLTGETCAIVLSVIITYLVLDVYWFILSGFLLGFSGGVSTLMSVSFAYVSDITPSDTTPPQQHTIHLSFLRATLPQQRTVHLGFLQGVVYISIALSSGIFNVWLQGTNCDFKPPSWLMVAVVLVGLVYSLIMPESLPKQERVQFSQSKKGMSVFLQGIKLFFWPRLKYSVWRLWLVALSIFVVVLVESGEYAITTLFLLHKPLEWNRAFIGIYAIVRPITHGLALFLVLPLFLYLKVTEPSIVIAGLIFTSGANIFLGFVKSTWEVFVGKYMYTIDYVAAISIKGLNRPYMQKGEEWACKLYVGQYSNSASFF